MNKLVCLFLVIVYISLLTAESELYYGHEEQWVFVGQTVQLEFPQVANYRRTVKNAKGKEIEHLYRVCNGKNKKVCGFWENTNTKKKVASGATSYNKNKKALIIKNSRKSDEGIYMTGNKKHSFKVSIYYPPP